MKKAPFQFGSTTNHPPAPTTAFQIRAARSYLALAIAGIWLLTLNTAISQTNTAPIQLLSVRSASAPLSVSGNGESFDPVISADGRYVAFCSEANDLTAGGNSRFVLNVYERDRVTDTTTLISANTNGTGGGNGDSIYPQISSNGQFVVFQSDASDLAPNDTNGVTGIFMHNMANGTTTLVSVAPDGSPANGASTRPVMTPDGRYVAFISSASNLTSGVSGVTNVFLRDMVLGTNYLISVGASESNAVMATPVVTPDGRYVAFFSTSTNLVPGIPAASQGEVYVRDRIAGTTLWASTNAAAIALTNLNLTAPMSYHPRLSADGQEVVFKTSTNEVGSPALILRYDVPTAATTIISTNGMAGKVDGDDDYGPEMTPDGEFVAYVKYEGTGSSSYLESSVHVWDADGGVDTLVSDPGTSGVITTASTQPVLSANDGFVAFLSDASDLAGPPYPSGTHIYVRNYFDGSLQLVDADTNGLATNDNSLALFSLSRLGRYIAFDSLDDNLVSGDNNQAHDVFTRDLYAHSTELISQRDPLVIPQSGDYYSMPQVSVSTNGQWVAFTSLADDLTPNDTNGVADVFVRDLLAGTTTLVSVGDGNLPLTNLSVNPVISGDGSYVVFISTATNVFLSPGPATYADIFRRDLQTQTTALVSVSSNGVDTANGDCASPAVSYDGRYVAFLSAAQNLVPGVGAAGYNRTYLRDMNTGVTTALTPGSSSYPDSIFAPSISADGRYVAYSSYSGVTPELRVWDDQLGMDIYTNSSGVSNAVLSADGNRVLCTLSPNIVQVADVKTGTNIFTFDYPVVMCGADGFSADGQYVAFVAQTSIASGTNIYLCDLQSQTITQIGDFVGGSLTPGNNDSYQRYADLPAISGDGRFVVYRSYASGIGSGDITPAPNIYRYDRLLGTTSNLTYGQTESFPILWDSNPVISGDGKTVAFFSSSPGLAPSDLNRTIDAFAFAVDIGVPLDTDGDGIPDWWMIQYFGHPTGLASDNSLAQDDADGTGMSNLQKYLAGLNPTNPASQFRITSVTPQGTNTLINWQAGGGRTNVVQAAAIVGGPYTNVSPDIALPGSGDVFTNYVDTTTNQLTRFYRIKLEP